MTTRHTGSLAKSCGATVLYAGAILLLVFSFAMTIELDNPAAFPGRRDNGGAYGALICVALAGLSSGVAVISLSRHLVSKIVCAAIVLGCIYRVVGASAHL